MRLPFVNIRDIFNIHNIYDKLQDTYFTMQLIHLIINDNMQDIMSTVVLFISTCDKTKFICSILKSISYISKLLSHMHVYIISAC